MGRAGLVSENSHPSLSKMRRGHCGRDNYWRGRRLNPWPARGPAQSRDRASLRGGGNRRAPLQFLRRMRAFRSGRFGVLSQSCKASELAAPGGGRTPLPPILRRWQYRPVPAVLGRTPRSVFPSFAFLRCLVTFCKIFRMNGVDFSLTRRGSWVECRVTMNQSEVTARHFPPGRPCG